MDVNTRSSGATVLWVTVAGVGLSFLAALVPFFSAGYQLHYGVLFAGFAPYLVYGFAAPLLDRRIRLAAGLLVIAVHVALLVNGHLTADESAIHSALFYGPLLLALLISPLWLVALRKPY